MGRPNRIKENDNMKTYLYVLGSIAGIAVIVFIATFVLYGGNESETDVSRFSTAKVNTLVPNDIISSSKNKTEQTSTQIGKSVNELIQTQNVIESPAKEDKQSVKNTTNNTKTTSVNVENKVEEKQTQTVETSNEEKDPIFVKPVDGEILREYAKDNLVYSETLKEWITHNGIDIKAERTSIVKSSADGRVSSIKNDPRYGLTVVIEHANGFKTVYSNLLTAEFVTIGEEISSGQTIGTIGSTATFEILDEPHLHFEILKDNESVDPNIYLQQ